MSNPLIARSIKQQINTASGVISILEDVSLELKVGESVAIQGASGSGKSTLLGILAGLDLPLHGKIWMNGRDLTELDEDERALLRADQVGFVFQSFYLMDDLTAIENVALPLELFGQANAFSKAEEWLQKLGMGHRMRHFPRQLSGGEQQRVALCRAFSVQPAILFADEPTANLDTVTAAAVLDQLFCLQREHSTSMVIATHDRALAQRCDRVLHLRSGRLVAEDQA
ncbi:ABC transporter ATP-binding protein [Arenicella xantha]|nr:ATP-binding cassette domain-containing protein [Arenicella xantha]